MQYDPDTGWLIHGQYEVRTANGQCFDLDVEPISDTGFHLNPALYGEWDGHVHGEWRGPLNVEGEHIADTTIEALVEQSSLAAPGSARSCSHGGRRRLRDHREPRDR